MIITCPSCRTRFRIAPASLGGIGRTVRCSSCGERWFVEPFTEAAPLPPSALVPIEPAPAGAALARAARRGGKAGWLLASLVVLLAAAALAGRNEIAARLPTTVPFYQLLGLPLELPLGMEFRELELDPAGRRGPNRARGDGRDRERLGPAARRPADPRGAARRGATRARFRPVRSTTAGAGAGRPRHGSRSSSARRRPRPATSRFRSARHPDQWPGQAGPCGR